MFPNCVEMNDIMQEVRDWLMMFPNTKEESITDFLEFRMTKRLYKIEFKQFNRHDEAHYTGADFDLILLFNKETWIFRIQAKKLKDWVNRKRFDYKKWKQMNLLIDSSRKEWRIPLYAFYYISEKNSACKNKKNDSVSLMGAIKIKLRMSLIRREWSKGEKLFKESMPLSCLFCCNKIDKTTWLGDFLSYYSWNNNPFDEETIEQWRYLQEKGYPTFINDILEMGIDWGIPDSLNEFSKNTNAIVFIDCRKEGQSKNYDL